jgi:hypothetical protein
MWFISVIILMILVMLKFLPSDIFFKWSKEAEEIYRYSNGYTNGR